MEASTCVHVHARARRAGGRPKCRWTFWGISAALDTSNNERTRMSVLLPITISSGPNPDKIGRLSETCAGVGLTMTHNLSVQLMHRDMHLWQEHACTHARRFSFGSSSACMHGARRRSAVQSAPIPTWEEGVVVIYNTAYPDEHSLSKLYPSGRGNPRARTTVQSRPRDKWTCHMLRVHGCHDPATKRTTRH